MLNNILTDVALKSRDVSVGEVSLYAILGFVVVVLGIVFLIFVVSAIGKGFTVNKSNSTTESKPAPKKTETAVQVQPKTDEDEISEELVAVITGAISAYYETMQPQCEFIVKRIKRI